MPSVSSGRHWSLATKSVQHAAPEDGPASLPQARSAKKETGSRGRTTRRLIADAWRDARAGYLSQFQGQLLTHAIQGAQSVSAWQAGCAACWQTVSLVVMQVSQASFEAIFVPP